jgi:hypothetical protein
MGINEEEKSNGVYTGPLDLQIYQDWGQLTHHEVAQKQQNTTGQFTGHCARQTKTHTKLCLDLL